MSIILVVAALLIFLSALLFIVVWMDRRRNKKKFYAICNESGIVFSLPSNWKCVHFESAVELEPYQVDANVLIQYHMLFEDVLEFKKAHIETVLEDGTVVPLICKKEIWTIHGLSWEVYMWEKSSETGMAGMKAFLRLVDYYLTFYYVLQDDSLTTESRRLYRRALEMFIQGGKPHVDT